MYQIFLIQVAFQSSDRVKLDFRGSVVKIALNFKSRETEKIELFSQGGYNFPILVNKTFIIADYKYVKLFRFAILEITLQLKDDNILCQF